MSDWFLLNGALLAFLLIQVVLVLWNRLELRRPVPRQWGGDAPSVSLLVPARNEEQAIGECLDHLVGQDYPSLEIVVLDDGSTDRTADIVTGYAPQGVRLLPGSPVPAGWTGKNWACHQLSDEATGDLLCFVDADTTLEPEAVSAAVAMLEDQGAGLVSMMPRSSSTSMSGAMLLPMVTHALFALIPVAVVHRAKTAMLSLAFGPFMLFSRDAYDAAGGHMADPGHMVDDVQMSRNVKRAGYPVRIANGTDLVATRWYDGVAGIWRGFSKNAYGALGYNPFVGVAVSMVIAPLLVSPFVRLVVGAAGSAPVPEIVVWQCLLLVGTRLLTAHLGRDALWTSPFHAVTVAFWGATLARSMLIHARRETVAWKDRDVPTFPQ